MAVQADTVVERVEIEDATQQGANSAIQNMDKVAAGAEKMSGAVQGTSNAFAGFDKAAGNSSRTLDRHRARADENERAMQMLIRAENDYNRAIRTGQATVEEKTRVLDQLWKQTIGAADAANQNAIALERQRQAADASQRAFNELLGVNSAVATSAKASASVFEEQARAEEEAARQAKLLEAANETLRSKYVPLHAIQQQYLAALREIRTAGPEVFRSERERAAALQRTKDAFAAQVVAIRSATDAQGRFNTMAASGGRAYGGFGSVVQQAGFQVADFAVQVESGQGVMRAFVQQGSQMLGFFGPFGAAAGAALAVVGGFAGVFLASSDAANENTSALEDYNRMVGQTRDISKEAAGAVRDLENAHKDAGIAALESGLAGAVVAQDQLQRQLRVQQTYVEALRGGVDSGGLAASGDELRQAERDLAAMIAQFDQNDEAINGMNNRLVVLRDRLGEVTTEIDRTTAAAADATKVDKAFAESTAAFLRARSAGLSLAESYNPLLAAQNEAYAKVIQLRDGAMAGAYSWEAYQIAIAGVRAEFQRSQDPLGTVLAGLKSELDLLKLSEDSRTRATRVQEKYVEAVRSGAPAIEATRTAIEKEVDAIIDQEQANARAAEAQRKATQEAERAAAEQANLARQREQTLQDLESEANYMANLAEAHKIGADAIFDVETARKAELVVQRLKLENLPEEADAIRAVVREIEEHKRSIDATIEAQKEAERAAEKSAREQERAAKKIEDAYGKVFENIRDFSEQALGDSFYDLLRGETVDFASFLETTLIRAIANVAAAAATQTIVMPIATSVVGAVPGLFGLGGAANQNSPGGGVGIGDIFGVGRSLWGAYSGGTGSLATSFAMSGIGQALGLSAAIPATIAPTAGATIGGGLAIGGYAGGTALTGAGTALAAAAPFLGVAAAALPLILGMTGAFQGPPSVGPTGVGRFTDPFDYDSGVFTSDNDGDASAVKAVGKEITGILGSLQSSMGFDNRAGYGFDIGYFSNPEDGSGRDAGFTLKEIIGAQLADENLFEGLEAGELVLEAVRATLQRGIDNVDSDQVAAAIQNSTAETIEEFLSDLDFAKELGDYVQNGLVAPLTPVEQAFENLADRFDAAKDKAEDLGLSVADVTSMFGDLNQQLVDQVQADLTAQLNAAQGNNFLNTLQGFLDQRDVNGANAAAAGIDIAVAGQIFSAQISGLLPQLTADQLSLILQNFDDEALTGAVNDVVDSLGGFTDTAGVSAADLAAGVQAFTKTLETEMGTLESATAQVTSTIRSLQRAYNSNLTDRDLSPLSTVQRLAESERQLMEAFALANDNTPQDAESIAAQERLADLAANDNQLAKDYYASSTDYAERFNRNQNLLQQTISNQQTIEQSMLSRLTEIRDLLEANDTGPGFGTSYTQQANGQYASDTGFDLGASPEVNLAILNALNAANLATPTGFGEGQLNALRASNPQVAAFLDAMHFANGAAFVNGAPVNYFANGTVVSSPTMFGMPSGLGMMAEAGPEAIMPLQRINGSLGVRATLPANDLGRTDLTPLAASIDRLSERVERLILLTADSGQANRQGLAEVAEGIGDVRHALRRAG